MSLFDSEKLSQLLDRFNSAFMCGCLLLAEKVANEGEGIHLPSLHDAARRFRSGIIKDSSVFRHVESEDEVLSSCVPDCSARF